MNSGEGSAGIGLQFEFEFCAQLKAPVTVGQGPRGTRMFFETAGGDVVGDRI